MKKIFHHPESQILSLAETKTYLSERWHRDYGAGLFFSALHDLDEHMFIPISIDGMLYYGCHGIFDGLSLLSHANKKFSLNLNLQAASKDRAPTSLKQKIQAFISALNSKPKQKHEYLSDPQPYSKASDHHSFHLVMDADAFTDNLTAYYLNKFSRFSMKRFSKNNISRWQISVNMRGETKKPKRGNVLASFFSIDCEEHDTVESTKLKLQTKLKGKEYLGFWYLSCIVRNLGSRLLTRLTKNELEKKESSWFGLFTNLGDIGGDGAHEVLIFPTVRWHRPIAALVYKHNGKIYLTVLLHKRLNVDSADIERIKDELRFELLQKNC
jgi:hypothetical protein